MMRLAATLAFAVVTTVAGTAGAGHHHKVWWEFLKGSWRYEASGGAGEISFALAPTGDALVGQWRSNDEGSSAYEVAGWQPDRKVEVVNGFGSQGNYWHIEFTKIAPESSEGMYHGREPDGTVVTGRIVIKKADANHWTWDITGKNENGEGIKRHGDVTRKTD